MGTGKTCKSCGSSELEVDPSRGDTVCTNCGTVLEDSAIVSEVQFEENSHGISSAIGQFVSSESSGGCRGFGNNFHASGVRESREITLQKAKRAVSNLCQNLRLNQHCLDTAFNFYKMALSRHLTRGRRQTHLIAACVYITCRIEGTPHLLIDFSEVLQICVFELGRTYLKLSQALCINVPALDPCLYVLRFANKLEFGDKTHEVTMTALRLVQRMKRDFMHTGRRPSGICGAALLMAARLHDFNRTVGDVVKVVQVHEATLRKRLVEFGETPSSSLTLAEFMTVDLEEEQDPPCYKLARARDRERLKALEDKTSVQQFTKLRSEIEKYILNKKNKKSASTDSEDQHDEESDLNEFVADSTFDILNDIESEELRLDLIESGLGPTIESMGLRRKEIEAEEALAALNEGNFEGTFEYSTANGELDVAGLDDDEIDSYIMNETESQRKDNIWTQLNAEYLKAKKEKEEKLKRELEEGKQPQEKKKRKTTIKKKTTTPANSAGEAIEKMLQEKKISAKINYDVLKSLNVTFKEMKDETGSINEIAKLVDMKAEIVTKEDILGSKPVEALKTPSKKANSDSNVKSAGVSLPVDVKEKIVEEQSVTIVDDEDVDEDDEEIDESAGGNEMMSVAQMLSKHHGEDDGYYNDYEDDDDY
ncbi:brf RNA polymerase III subunit isoform X1 [Rhodnius prolixus]|uniref:brf RNA polymerase III subunit isoform X1 n=1 Tax=Rhodnius prolixus TaxID=13249 RepID=UPI003D18DF71